MDLTGGMEQKYDLEGIAITKDGGFLAFLRRSSEKEMKHLLLRFRAMVRWNGKSPCQMRFCPRRNGSAWKGSAAMKTMV